MSIYGISLFGMIMCFGMKRRHLEWRIKIVVLLKTCPGLIRKRYRAIANNSLFPSITSGRIQPGWQESSILPPSSQSL